MAGGNAGYNCSKTGLSNGALWTCIYTQSNNDYWRLIDTYTKSGGGTITAKFGFNYHGYSYEGGWFSQSSGTEKQGQFNDLGFNDCSDIVGWMAVQGQNTFYNAPVTIC
ncbi:hypothetical protein BU198_16190 [Streptomyces sp. CBMA156]|nr:hypothetical protein [Streptomyces sp. CBMA156]